MSDSLPVFTKEADAWRWLAKRLEDGESLGICIGILKLHYHLQISALMRRMMEDRLTLFQPDNKDLSGYWWTAPFHRGYVPDDRIIACCFLATLAENGVTL